MFDEDADKVLEATAKGDVETMTTIIVSMAAEGLILRKERDPGSLTPRTRWLLKSTTSRKN